MKIAEVFLLEAYFDDLQSVVMDRLAQYASDEQSSIPTEEFRQALASDGFLLSMNELQKALTDMDVVANVDANTITPKGAIDNDLTGDMEPQVDVHAMAGDQAMADVNTTLPQ
jgi:secreted trypsin-like serine protease|tara:strand:- start:13508 stop:13846 length:339 start_codon:yes stop_codon:yes gene_type:complete